jgi:hypothetical protein
VVQIVFCGKVVPIVTFFSVAENRWWCVVCVDELLLLKQQKHFSSKFNSVAEVWSI